MPARRQLPHHLAAVDALQADRAHHHAARDLLLAFTANTVAFLQRALEREPRRWRIGAHPPLTTVVVSTGLSGLPARRRRSHNALGARQPRTTSSSAAVAAKAPAFRTLEVAASTQDGRAGNVIEIIILIYVSAYLLLNLHLVQEAAGSKEEMAMTIISKASTMRRCCELQRRDRSGGVGGAALHACRRRRVREARIQSLRSEFDGLKMSYAESVDDFAAKFTTLVGRIRELGDPMEEKYVVKKLLRVVSKKYISVASSIGLFCDVNKMSMEEAFGSLKARRRTPRGQEEGGENSSWRGRVSRGDKRGHGRAGGRRDRVMQSITVMNLGILLGNVLKEEEKALLAKGYADDEPALL
ncbi:hypothetical protein QYE76_007528 [Lolium multiflorum]|uniref:Uncharacterized protein n=1 Tax=Lolium multiflorum TaxID=4521 RepID=A0AAD8UTI3_LOLMU|nr:hypothetical protein QYE76_007528 [Lolium multiflorum]